MIRNKFLTRFIVVTLTTALLLMTGSRAIPVSALADPQIIPELAPVFDTEIIRLQDYVENNVAAPQFEIFNILLGLYVAGQGGFAEYKLHDPYANSSDVLDWLKSCGIRLYNHLIGMGAIGPDPITGIDYRPYIKGAADIAMGCAVKATQYEDVNDFVSDVNVQDKYFIPMDFGIQGALNYLFAQDGGLYNWQFEESDFTSTKTYNSVVLLPTNPYWGLIESLNPPIVRYNDATSPQYSNFVASTDFFSQYTNILLNTTTGRLNFYKDDGTVFPQSVSQNNYVRYVYATQSGAWSWYYSSLSFRAEYTYPVLDTYPDIIQNLIDTNWFCTNSNYNFFINDFVKHYYYGPNWSNKTEIFHSTDLNLDPNTLPYYQQVTNNYLLDVKGILEDLIGEVDLTNIILNNLFDVDGVLVHDPELIHVTTEILEEIQTINVPIPVNMNDIAELTDNTYLERVKEHARNAGDIFANYVAFWHNCDSDLVYTVFGAAILVLVGAFIGKWGHS